MINGTLIINRNLHGEIDFCEMKADGHYLGQVYSNGVKLQLKIESFGGEYCVEMSTPNHTTVFWCSNIEYREGKA